jgi:predicted DNA-binding protein with PD1-like motif
MVVIEVLEGELIEEIRQAAKQKGITDAAVVSLIGAVDSFTASTMPAHDATKNIMTEWAGPAEMSGTGEVINGEPHLHVVMGVANGRTVSGHLHRAEIRTHSARAYLLPSP